MSAVTFEDAIFSRAVFPALLAAVFLLIIWNLDRSLGRGAPRTPVRAKLLSHSFIGALGMSYFIAWNDIIAGFLRLPGWQVWKPLTAVWGLLVFYDGWRRVEIQKIRAQTESAPNDHTTTVAVPAREGWRLNVASVL
ncbi:MAG TPA: hypothetical protein VMF66_08410, partial [Candidatus Acidoferrum sp.]|nr:hypothetical protein [Candidatus Acidoferrum sp.]